MKNKFENGRNKPKKTIEHTDDDSIENVEQEIVTEGTEELDIIKEIEEIKRLERIYNENNLIWEAEAGLTNPSEFYKRATSKEPILTDESIDANGNVDEKPPTESQKKAKKKSTKEIISKISKQLSKQLPAIALTATLSTGLEAKVNSWPSIDIQAIASKCAEENFNYIEQDHGTIRNITEQTGRSQTTAKECLRVGIEKNIIDGVMTFVMGELSVRFPSLTQEGRQFNYIFTSFILLPKSEDGWDKTDVTGIEISGKNFMLQLLEEFSSKEMAALFKMVEERRFGLLADGTPITGSLESNAAANTLTKSQLKYIHEDFVPSDIFDGPDSCMNPEEQFMKLRVIRAVTYETIKLLQRLKDEKNTMFDITSQPLKTPLLRKTPKGSEIPQSIFPINKRFASIFGVKTPKDLVDKLSGIEVEFNNLAASIFDKDGNFAKWVTPEDIKNFKLLRDSVIILNITQEHRFLYTAREQAIMEYVIELFAKYPDMMLNVVLGTAHNLDDDFIKAFIEGKLSKKEVINNIETVPYNLAEARFVGPPNPNEPNFITGLNTDDLIKILHGGEVTALLNVYNPSSNRMMTVSTTIDKNSIKSLFKDERFVLIYLYALVATEKYGDIFANFPEIRDTLGADDNFLYNVAMLAYETGHLRQLVDNKKSILENISDDRHREISKLIREAKKILAKLKIEA